MVTLEVTRWQPRFCGGIVTVFWAHLAVIDSDDLRTAETDKDNFLGFEKKTPGMEETDEACIASAASCQIPFKVHWSEKGQPKRSRALF